MLSVYLYSMRENVKQTSSKHLQIKVKCNMCKIFKVYLNTADYENWLQLPQPRWKIYMVFLQRNLTIKIC